jgi:hypothetical protein
MSLLWSSKRLTVVSPCEPVLLVALLGFDPGEALALQSHFEMCDALGAQWRIGACGPADLWIVNGPSTRVHDGEAIEVDGMRFRPGEMARPVAFAGALAPAIDARFRFNPDSPKSLAAMLGSLARWLLPRVLQQVLVGHLIANAARFTRSTVIHVQDAQRLLAVMNFAGDTGIAADATPFALRSADWVLRPAGTGRVPPIFHAAPTEEVLWRFATRAEGLEVLPPRYLRLPIYLRRMPRLAAHELSTRQAAALAALAKGRRTLRELRAMLDCAEPQICGDLAALYLVGAITCDPMRALGSTHRGDPVAPPGIEPSTVGSGELAAPAASADAVSA